jgi:FMN phosphatase YigB (HAD superfamily)
MCALRWAHDGRRIRRTLLLDACGVLLGEPTGPLFEAVADSCDHSPDAVAVVFRERFRDILWSGQIDEDAFWSDFANSLGTDHPCPSWRGVIDASMHGLPALHCLPAWSQQAEIIVISNHRREWLLPRLDALGATKYADELCISSSTGLVKPDPAAYTHAVRGRERSRTLYVDDKLANVEAARDLGFRSLLADPKGSWMEVVEAWLET